MTKEQIKIFIENAKKTIDENLLDVITDGLEIESNNLEPDEFVNLILDNFIYYDDQWQIMKVYSVPADNKTFNECLEMFENELYECL